MRGDGEDRTPGQGPEEHQQEAWRELNHRVANSLQLAASFLQFQQRRLSDPEAREALAAAGARLDAVGRLHRFLYTQESGGTVDLQAFFGELCPGIAASTGLRCDMDIEPLRVPSDLAQHLGIAINELAINAGKHAYAEGEPGEIRIRSACENGLLILTIADGGMGLPEGFDPRAATGLGMRVVLAVVRQFGGALEVENDHGARFILKLPLPILA